MKQFFILTCCAFLCLLTACEKETTENHNSNSGNNDPVNLIGTWMPTNDAYFKVMLYYEDGTFCDSLYADYAEEGGFVFTNSTQVETPWGVTATYSITQDSIFFNLMGVVTRGYKLLDCSNSHLSFENTEIGQYTTANDNGGTDTLVGYEYDHWDLKKI